MMEASIFEKVDIVNEENRAPKADANPLDESPSHKARLNKRRREREGTPEYNQLMTEAAETMDKLELKKV